MFCFEPGKPEKICEDGKEELVEDNCSTGIGLGHVKVLTVQVVFEIYCNASTSYITMVI